MSKRVTIFFYILSFIGTLGGSLSCSAMELLSDPAECFVPKNAYEAARQDLVSFIDIRLQKIEGRMHCQSGAEISLTPLIAPVAPHQFVVVEDWREPEYRRIVEQAARHVSEEIGKIDIGQRQEQMKHLISLMKFKLGKIDELRETVPAVMLRIADTPEQSDSELYERFSKTYDYLSRYGIAAHQVYEYLEFQSEQRSTLSQAHIKERFAQLTETSPLVDAELAGKIRQAFFILRSAASRANYDAFLDGPQHVGKLKILPIYAERYRIDCGIINQELMTYKTTLEPLLKRVSSQQK